MNTFVEYLLLALAGHALHMLKVYKSTITRKESFITKSLLINEVSNLIAIPLAIYLAPTLGAEVIVMSPATAVLIGVGGSSFIAGFINVKKPKLDTSGDDV